MNFWKDLPRPFTALAPLDGVTDHVFRQIVTKLGKPDVLFTEFTSCEGLFSIGGDKVALNLEFNPDEQPVIAQVWGTDPGAFYETAKIVAELGFAGIDINMGCPHYEVIKHGACSGLINNHELAKEIIEATKHGAGEIPVSVKTRIGFQKEMIEDWLGFLMQQDLAALTVHLRTVEEMSKVPAHWELMPKIVELKNKVAPQTVLVGNGDITSLEEVQTKFEQYHCDGFMVGRGIFSNPWLFNPEVDPQTITADQRLQTFIDHIDLYTKIWGDLKSFEPLKKFGKTYVNQFQNAAHFREELMNSKTIEELRSGVVNLQKQLKS